MKKIINIIIIVLIFGALAITNNKIVEVPAAKTGVQGGYTKEDYDRYLEYKNNLIDEYGEDIYRLMNQEAGIETEEESFKHFMEYGI